MPFAGNVFSPITAAATRSLETCVYGAVVDRSPWSSSSWTRRMSAPPSSSCVGLVYPERFQIMGVEGEIDRLAQHLGEVIKKARP